MKEEVNVYGLRDYQQQIIKEVYDQWRSGNKRVMVQSVTGSGKTVTFGTIAKACINKGYQVLILVHRKELALQAADKVGTITGVEPSIIKAGYTPDMRSPLQIASIQSLTRRLHLPLYPKLIIADECHHIVSSTNQKILNYFPDAYLLGVTATPTRLNGQGFHNVFDSLVIGPKLKDLIDQGHLSKFKLFADPSPMSTKGVGTQGGDYKNNELAKSNDAITLSGNLVKSYQQRCPGKRVIIFAINVEHSIQIAKRYNEAGIPAAHLDGTTPEDIRQKTIDAFSRGELLALSNVGLFDEGFDLPALDAVQIAKPTKSLTRWLQMVGRVLRTSPDKDHAIILDHTLNFAIHGLPTREREWSLEGVKQEDAPLKVCKETGEVVPNPEKEKTGIEELDILLKEVTEEAEHKDKHWLDFLEQLLSFQQEQGYQAQWVRYKLQILKPPVSVWNAYGDYMGYKTGWGYHRLKEQQGVRKPPADIEGYFMNLVRDNTVPITLPLDSRHFG